MNGPRTPAFVDTVTIFGWAENHPEQKLVGSAASLL
jgi:hypothetical protein